MKSFLGSVVLVFASPSSSLAGASTLQCKSPNPDGNGSLVFDYLKVDCKNEDGRNFTVQLRG